MSNSPVDQSPDAALLPTLQQQLERMRAMHYKYSDLFYKLILVGLLALIVMAMASLTEPLRATVLLIPFFTIYIGVQSAYFLSYTFFARVYATGIEKRINEILRRDLLIAHRIEAAYLYPLSGPQFAGVMPRLGQTFIAFITVHFWLLGAAIIALSTYRAWQLLPDLARTFPPANYYLIALAGWSLLHLIYLIWYFGARRHERRIMRIVADAYGTDYENL
ncbi:MAG TPA: hypothetical protein VM870_07000 [Pyrinomonadaceae bacterium]|nr:hypothetical protein [Pyrinomonadaceae bacterium]